MIDSKLRSVKDRLAEPIALPLSNIHPNTLSLMGLFIGLGSALLAFLGVYYWALALWLTNRALDGLDGLVARLHGKQDDFGGYLDILCDNLVYAALPIGLVLGTPSLERYAALIAILAAFYLNTVSWLYLSAILEKRAIHNLETQTTIVMPSGLIGGFETIVFYGIFILFPEQVVLLFLIFFVLVIFTVFQRFIWARYYLRQIHISEGYTYEN
jgi:phosphatidylglycerophosphate synthase